MNIYSFLFLFFLLSVGDVLFHLFHLIILFYFFQLLIFEFLNVSTLFLFNYINISMFDFMAWLDVVSYCLLLSFFLYPRMNLLMWEIFSSLYFYEIFPQILSISIFVNKLYNNCPTWLDFYPNDYTIHWRILILILIRFGKKLHQNRMKKIFLTITDLFLDTKKMIETNNIIQNQARPKNQK